MIEPGRRTGQALVRGFAACLSSVTEVPLEDLPQLTEAGPLPHALASWRSWLAGRGSGLVPIADPSTFQWAGWWIAVVDRSDSPMAVGPQQQVAALAFGTPPGIVLSPQDPHLLGRATADLPISNAFASRPSTRWCRRCSNTRDSPGRWSRSRSPPTPPRPCN